MKRTGAIILHPPAGPSDVEQMVSSAKEASACDLVQALQSLVPTIIVVCSPDSSVPGESTALVGSDPEEMPTDLPPSDQNSSILAIH